jgi:glutamate/tyrosine decarboxylase-like PLP-dependent enzyme
MHLFEPEAEALAKQVFGYVEGRLAGPPSLNAPMSEDELGRLAGETISEEGLGATEAFRIFEEVLAPACVNTSHPRFLSFVPNAPTIASILFDLAVSASAISADWWIEASGAVHAENEALRWIAGVLGLPAEAGGAFVSGGTAGNLSALAVARDAWRRRGAGAGRPAVAITAGGHSSLRLAARILDVEVVEVDAGERGRMLGPALEAALERTDREVFAVAVTAGSTNFGAIDELGAIADCCEERGIWMHVDGAYGGAAALVPAVRPQFEGIERADSFVVDPHKWLFAPFDCAALIYRDPLLAAAAFTQKAEYIDVIEERAEWNPSDFAIHLTRRARGLPLWFSLAANGWRPYAEAIERCIAMAREAAAMIEASPGLELYCEPGLSVVVFRRLGWGPADYQRWSEQALADGLTMTVPTSWDGETLLRFCFINPTTGADEVAEILASLA